MYIFLQLQFTLSLGRTLFNDYVCKFINFDKILINIKCWSYIPSIYNNRQKHDVKRNDLRNVDR